MPRLVSCRLHRQVLEGFLQLCARPSTVYTLSMPPVVEYPLTCTQASTAMRGGATTRPLSCSRTTQTRMWPGALLMIISDEQHERQRWQNSVSGFCSLCSRDEGFAKYVRSSIVRDATTSCTCCLAWRAWCDTLLVCLFKSCLRSLFLQPTGWPVPEV